MSSWPRTTRAKVRARRQLTEMRRLRPLLAVMQAQQDRLDSLERAVSQLPLLSQQQHRETLAALVVTRESQEVLLLELLQATQPPAEKQMADLLNGQPPPSRSSSS